MKSWSSLITATLIPPTKVYRDAHGNFAGTSTDITPALFLFARIFAWIYYIGIILLPLLAPVYYLAVRWYCNKYDSVNTQEDPEGWPIRKHKLIKKFTWIFVIWCGYMLYGYMTDWGVPKYNDEPVQKVTKAPGPVYDYNGKKIWDPEWQKR